MNGRGYNVEINAQQIAIAEENELATGKWPELAGWKTCHYVVAGFPACQFSGLSSPELTSAEFLDI